MKLKIPKFSHLQYLVHTIAWILVAWLVWDAVTGNLTINPIQAAEQRTGRYAIYFLVLSLACTPLNTVFGLRQAISARRSLGLYAFMFAAAHLFILIGVDYGFQFGLLLADVGTKRYILVGALTFSILLLLAITSFRWWQKRLQKNWTRLHRLIYPAALLAVLHFAWARKGDIFSLSGDILLPLALGVIVLILLALRLRFVRKTAVRFRSLILQMAQERSAASSRILRSRIVENQVDNLTHSTDGPQSRTRPDFLFPGDKEQSSPPKAA